MASKETTVARPKAMITRTKKDRTIAFGPDGPPQRHEFGARWLSQAIARGTARVEVTIQTADGPVVYRLAAGESVYAWPAQLVEGGAS